MRRTKPGMESSCLMRATRAMPAPTTGLAPEGEQKSFCMSRR